MKNIFLTLGSQPVLDQIIQTHPERQFYLMTPWQNDTDDDQLLELTDRPSVSVLPIAYTVRYTSTPQMQPFAFNNFMFFSFNTDEDDGLWKRLVHFTESTKAPTHHSLLAVKAGARKQYLLYTSWQNVLDWQTWREQPAFKTITELKARSTHDWRYSETCYTLK